MRFISIIINLLFYKLSGMAEVQTSMDHYEFELRYMAYKGMSTRFNFGRDDDFLVKLIQKTSKGTLEKALTETSPADLKNFTFQTYTPFKRAFLQAWENIFPWSDKRFSLTDYINRLEYELKVIREMGYNSYFLIVSDYVKRAKENKIWVWPGRWSWAGSVLAWFIEITNIDPMPFDLIFERFLNPARVSMPDFDIDFEDTRRQDVIEYCSKKYGSEKVCAIGTFMKMKGKNAFKDTGRVLWVWFMESNYYAGFINEKKTALETIQDPTEEQAQPLRDAYENTNLLKDVINLSHNFKDNMRQTGVHACGIIIAPAKVTTYTPTQYCKEEDHTIVSQYDGPTLESIGLLKMDFLGLKNLSIIKNCIKIIKARKDKNGEPLPDMFQHYLDTMNFIPPLDDVQTYEEVFKQGETTGIFQFESTGMKKYLIQLEPNVFSNLVAMVALYRPWPLEFIPSYIARKQGQEAIEYLYPDLREELTKKYGKDVPEEERKKLIEDLDPIMGDTYGIAIYQEQLMFLVQAMAGFSLWEADLLRRAIGKKKKYIIEKLKGEFIERCGTFRGYKEETATQIYEKMIEPAASYSFNKSHAVCYAFVSYQTGYLKAHYPIEYYAALIRSEEENTDKQSIYIEEIQQRWIKVLAPDINISFNHVAAIDQDIRLWFCSIKWVGSEVGEVIQQEREKNGKFTSVENFCKRCQNIINKKSLEGLIKAWTFDSFKDRNLLLSNIPQILEWIKNAANADQGFFWWLESTIPFQKTTPSTLMGNLMMEQEVFSSFLSGNPLDGLYPWIKKNAIFYSQINATFQGNFTLICYITDFVKAKKKGVFVKCCDISWNFDFFLPDMYGLKKFDLLIISGYKKNKFTITKIVKTDHERLKTLAWWSYDPSLTALVVKKMRYGEQKKEDIEKIKQESLEKKEEKKSEWTPRTSENDIASLSEDIWESENEDNGESEEILSEDSLELTENEEQTDSLSDEEEPEESFESNHEETSEENSGTVSEKTSEGTLEGKTEEPENTTSPQLEIQISDLSNIVMFQLSGVIKSNPWNVPILLKGVQGGNTENTEKIVSVTPETLERIKNLLHLS